MVQVKGRIGARREDLRELDFLVDTGSLYTFLPPALAETLGIDFPVISQVVLADNRQLDVPLGLGYLQLNDREGGILVGSLDVPMPLLGASALEVLGLNVNPREQTLEHSRPFSAPPALAGATSPRELAL